MAPPSSPTKSSAPDTHATPLADHFFIAGIETSQIYDEKVSSSGGLGTPAEATIEEEHVLETPVATSGQTRPSTDDARPTTPGSMGNSPTATTSPPQNESARNSKTRFSFEARKSIGSIINVNEGKTTGSNRSSATITALQSNGRPITMTEQDFEQALRKFANERENILDDIKINAGVSTDHTKPRPRPKTQRILSDDSTTARGGIGSVRRRLSTMNSMNRKPSTMSRQASTRTTRRLSGYNSVIPAPQPFQSTPGMHPLKRRYEPVLLDRYPSKNMADELKRRNPFPDYVPMFTFPNDISVVSADERPRATWHGFSMTNSDGSRLYGICLIVWVPLNAQVAEALEQQCEQWRRDNMTNEERELANSLGERLASERAKLSRLLSRLPSVPSDSPEREALEDDIGQVEEKIALMADLLRPVRHAAASKIEGLTDGETGLWVPRAYGILGRDIGMAAFWKEWLRAVVVPMTNGAILRVPASSPRVGMWQPLERYVVNLCVEALSPMSSKTQVELGIRELKLFARKEADNEIPGSRTIDIYALFRALTIPNIVTLFEYVLAEARIILLSSHTAMLHLVSQALVHLIYPFNWAGVFIPVLPARLLQALEAPCPYIVGIERRYENIELPSDDFVLVDLDEDVIESTARPVQLPRPQRRKLISLLQNAAPHHNRFGVPVGAPAFATEAFPYDAFSSENGNLFNSKPARATLQQYVSTNSSSFADVPNANPALPVLNAFVQSRNDGSSGLDQRPPQTTTSKASRESPPSPHDVSPATTPVSMTFSQHFPPPGLSTSPLSRNDSGLSLQASLREKRSGQFDTASKRSSTFMTERANARRPSVPFHGHVSTGSTSSTGGHSGGPIGGSIYAPSVYAPSTMAASTVMPHVLMQPVHNTSTTQWVEGHCMIFTPRNTTHGPPTCNVCEDRIEDGGYRCNGCPVTAHARCLPQLCIVCPVAFRSDQIRAAFVRCFASLLYTYRKFLGPAPPSAKGGKDKGRKELKYQFNMDGFLKSMPYENSEYVRMLRETQAFNEFIHQRETTPSTDPSIRLFDEIILSKRMRGRFSSFPRSLSSGRSSSQTPFLSDNSEHLWRTAVVTPGSQGIHTRFPGDYRAIVSRTPAKLDPAYIKEPRVVGGVPRPSRPGEGGKVKRKGVPSLLSLSQRPGKDGN